MFRGIKVPCAPRSSSSVPDFDLQAFRSAALSSDPVELGKAYRVQAAFENTHNHLIGIAQDIAKLKAWLV